MACFFIAHHHCEGALALARHLRRTAFVAVQVSNPHLEQETASFLAVT